MKRLAFIIGISDYEHRKKLNNAEDDARAIANVLRSLKFEVIDRYNCTYTEAKDTYYDVLNKLIDKYEAVVFYFSGHGEIINSTDCLLMKDTPLRNNDSDIKPKGYSLLVEEIMKDFNGRGNQTNILIIDACRVAYDDERGTANKNTGTTIGKLPYQSFIAFSTAPGDTAKDGKKGDHSPFTKSLLSHILEENLDIEILFKKVRSDVKIAGYSQYPWEHTCLVERFCFNYGQMNKYYGLPYDRNSYIRSEYESIPDSKEAKILENLSSTDYHSQTYALELLFSSHQGLTTTQKFHLGRLIYNKAANGSGPCERFLEKASNFQLIGSGNQNHLLRGIYYEIFFDANDNIRKKPYGNPNILSKIENLRQSLKDKDSENFVLEYIPKEVGTTGYLLGRTSDYKFNIKLSYSEQFDSDWRNILQIEDIRISNKSILPEIKKDMDNLLINWVDLRDKLTEYYGLPYQKIVLNPSIAKNGSWEYMSLADELPDILSFLEEFCRTTTPDEVDMLSTLSYIEDIEDQTLTEVYQHEDEMTIKGSMEVSVHLEFDREDMESMSFPGEFSIKLVKVGQDWTLQEKESSVRISTGKYYE